MKPGEDVKDVDKGWVDRGCQKLGEPGACFCTLCLRRIIYATSGKKNVSLHVLDPSHRVAVRAIQHTSRLPGATATTADIPV